MTIESLPVLKNILVVRLDNIGDVIMLSPALRALRKAYPAARITLLCSPAGNEAARLLLWIDATIIWKAAWQDISKEQTIDQQKEIDLVDLLRGGSFDAAFIFTSFSQSPYPPAYVAYLAGIPIRVGQSKEFGGRLLTHWFQPLPDHTHQVDRNLHVLREFGIPDDEKIMELWAPEADQRSVDQLLFSHHIDPTIGWIAAVTGASCAARRYDPERFARTIQLLSKHTGHQILILGSLGDMPYLGSMLEVTKKDQNVVSLVGETSTGEFAEIIRRARLVIANNSAALHIADAFQRPVVVLYSGTEYLTQWEPRYSPARVLNRPVPCSPCYRFRCPYQMECLDISPDEVASSVMELLEETASVPSIPYRVNRSSPEVKTR